jgi:hypothetical protein
VLAVCAGNAVECTERANAIRYHQTGQAVQSSVSVGRVRGVELVAVADPSWCATLLDQTHEHQVVVARNAEQVANAGFIEPAQKEVADLHPPGWAAAGHSCLLSFAHGNVERRTWRA